MINFLTAGPTDSANLFILYYDGYKACDYRCLMICLVRAHVYVWARGLNFFIIISIYANIFIKDILR